MKFAMLQACIKFAMLQVFEYVLYAQSSWNIAVCTAVLGRQTCKMFAHT